MENTDKYNFEKWVPAGKSSRVKRAGRPETYIIFSRTTLYFSTGMLKQAEQASNGADTLKFDLLVNRDDRVFAVKFHEAGEYVVKAIPCQISASRFIKEMEPIQNSPIEMTYGKDASGQELWIGGLGGNGQT